MCNSCYEWAKSFLYSSVTIGEYLKWARVRDWCIHLMYLWQPHLHNGWSNIICCTQCCNWIAAHQIIRTNFKLPVTNLFLKGRNCVRKDHDTSSGVCSDLWVMQAQPSPKKKYLITICMWHMDHDATPVLHTLDIHLCYIH